MSRARFELTTEQLERLLNAGKPTPVMYLSGGVPMSQTPQENANDCWKSLGKELGFVWDSARPIDGEPQNVFTAEVADKPQPVS